MEAIEPQTCEPESPEFPERNPTVSIRPRISLLVAAAIIAGLASSPKTAQAQTTDVGTFAVTNIDTKKCMTTSTSLANGPDEVGEPWAATAQQQWAFFRLPNGFYAIMNAKTTEFIFTPTGPGAIGVPAVSEGPWTYSLSQMWYLYPFGNNVYAIVNAQTGSILTDTLNKTMSGGSLGMLNWNANPDQLWYLYYLRP